MSKIAAQKKVFFSLTLFGLLRFLVFFNGLFVPTSWSWMSNIFKDSESLRKSNGKKWSNIWTFLFGSGLKLPRNKKFFFCWVCLGPPSYGIGATICIGREMLCLSYAGFWQKCRIPLFQIFFRIFFFFLQIFTKIWNLPSQSPTNHPTILLGISC